MSCQERAPVFSRSSLENCKLGNRSDFRKKAPRCRSVEGPNKTKTKLNNYIAVVFFEKPGDRRQKTEFWTTTIFLPLCSPISVIYYLFLLLRA